MIKTYSSRKDIYPDYLPHRRTVVLVAVISLINTIVDSYTDEENLPPCPIREAVDNAKLVLKTEFQTANLLLLLGSIVENAALVQIYVWCTLTFVVLGFVIALAELLINIKSQGYSSFISFIPEVAFLFTISHCLPTVDRYRQYLDNNELVKTLKTM